MNKNKNVRTNENTVGAHDCARINNNKPTANAVGATIGRPKDHNGITLVALIITVIVMLILLGVTVNIALNGGLFGMTKEAVKQTEIAAYKEKIDAERINIIVEQISKGLTSKEFMDRYEEELRKSINFKDSIIKRKDDETITITTKEGYVFEITEEGTNYEGDTNAPETPENPPSDDNNKITLTPNPTGWTSGNVTVTATYGANLTQDRTLECTGTAGTHYTISGNQVIVMKDGQTVTAKAKDAAGNEVVATQNINNIDREPPTITASTYNATLGDTIELTLNDNKKDSSGHALIDCVVANRSGEVVKLNFGDLEDERTYKADGSFVVSFKPTKSGTWTLWALEGWGIPARGSEPITIEVSPFAAKIRVNPSKYYGSEVRGYTAGGVDKWRIFYADENNIYLIADDYIPYTSLPTTTDGVSLTKGDTDYKAYWNTDALNSYSGSAWIKANSKAKAWLSKYLDSYQTSENANIKAVAYMMDTNKWSKFATDKADYAIGGPTIEMFCASYEDTHPNRYIECNRVTANGYQLKWSDGTLNSYNHYVRDLTKDDFNSIYIKSTTTKAKSMWLASSSARASECVNSADNDGVLGSDYYNESDFGYGFRPLVCLNSDVRLTEVSNGVYSIE